MRDDERRRHDDALLQRQRDGSVSVASRSRQTPRLRLPPSSSSPAPTPASPPPSRRALSTRMHDTRTREAGLTPNICQQHRTRVSSHALAHQNELVDHRRVLQGVAEPDVGPETVSDDRHRGQVVPVRAHVLPPLLQRPYQTSAPGSRSFRLPSHGCKCARAPNETRWRASATCIAADNCSATGNGSSC